MGHGRRPRALQIRLVSGNACIIGTPTPSTTRPRTSHDQVIMNQGLESKPRAGREARLHLLGAQQTRAVVRESGRISCAVHACMRIRRDGYRRNSRRRLSPQRRDAHSCLIVELCPTFGQLSPPPLRMLFKRLSRTEEEDCDVDGKERKRSKRIRLHSRSCLPMSIHNASDYGIKRLVLHRRRTCSLARDQNDNLFDGFFSLKRRTSGLCVNVIQHHQIYETDNSCHYLYKQFILKN